jgi:hypothetical protein
LHSSFILFLFEPALSLDHKRIVLHLLHVHKESIFLNQ